MQLWKLRILSASWYLQVEPYFQKNNTGPSGVLSTNVQNYPGFRIQSYLGFRNSPCDTLGLLFFKGAAVTFAVFDSPA